MVRDSRVLAASRCDALPFFSSETILFHAKSDIIGLCEHVYSVGFTTVASVVCSHESHHVQFEYLSKEVLCLAFANTNEHLVC